MNRKFTLLVLSCIFLINAQAQWSNTTNQFYDSLDMPVVQAANDQKNAIIIKSESDGGYFVIWEDYRNSVNSADIYAQKYDKDGNRLWAENGVPVATGETNQRYSFTNSSARNFRNYNYAAADGAGGFYITWMDYVSSKSRVSVQHVLTTGTRVFGDFGFAVGDPTKVTGKDYVSPQLIADGLDGFFIGYGEILSQQSKMLVYVYDFKDENGTLKQNGGGIMNAYLGLQGPYYYCPESGAGGYVDGFTDAYSGALATEFSICSDGQNGCNVVMAVWPNSQQGVPGFNRLCRVKKDSNVMGVGFFKKDSVVQLYSPYLKYFKINCVDPSVTCPTPGGCTVETTVWAVINQGFKNLLAGESPYNENFPGGGRFVNTVFNMDHIRAVLLTREGDGGININALLITWNQQDLNGSNTVSDWTTHSYTLAQEIYESLPYQLYSPNTSSAYSVDIQNRPAEMNKLNEGQSDLDTLLSTLSSSSYDYALTPSGNRAFMATLGYGDIAPVYYQELNFSRQSANSFALKLNTSSKNGILIGSGIQNYTSSDYPPAFAADKHGNALFYYGKYHSYLQASPVAEGGKMLWGNLGAPLSPDIWQGTYTNPDAPFAYINEGGKGIMVWQDSRKLADGTYSSNNIYMRHLDSLLQPGYRPPLHAQLLGGSTYYANRSTHLNINGASNAWTTFQALVYNGNGLVSEYTPLALIKDDYDLGTVTVSAQDNIGATRTTPDGKPYLNRNYTITVTNHPGGANIHVRLIFTKSEFDSLKAYDPTIQDPGDLAVIKQPNSSGTLSNDYTPVAGEKGIKPVAWAAIESTAEDGAVSVEGYYIEIVISDFSNFFIGSASTILPVSLQNFTAVAVNSTSVLRWQTASEINNSKFEIERSPDGKTFTKIGTVSGHGTSSEQHNYSFIDETPFKEKNYYRLAQVDLDGKRNYSEIGLVNFVNQENKIEVYPNPVQKILHLHLAKTSVIGGIIDVYNIQGRKVLQQHIPAGTTDQDVDFTSLVAGTYLLRYDEETIKVIKQ